MDLIGIIAVAVVAAGVAVWNFVRLRRLARERELLDEINTDLVGRAKLLEDASPEAIVSFDARGLIRSVNRRAEKLFGYAEADLFGRSILTLVPHLHSDRRPNGQRLEIRRKDGAQMIMDFRAERPARNNHTYLFFNDEHSRNGAPDAEPPLAVMERVVQRIVGEFEGPLTTINGYSELTLPTAPQDSSVHDYLQEIAAASDRASRITHTLLAFTGKQALPAEPLDVNALVRSLDHEIRAAVTAEVHLETPSEPAFSLLNAESLREAIRMLCASAQRRMGQGDRLEICITEQSLSHARSVYSGELPAGEYHVLRIADTGRQLSEAAMAHLFEPLYLNRDEVGVELSPIYGLIHRTGGRIDCSSSRKGTAVELYLPCASVPGPR